VVGALLPALCAETSCGPGRGAQYTRPCLRWWWIAQTEATGLGCWVCHTWASVRVAEMLLGGNATAPVQHTRSETGNALIF
jgi:hypothetical protein